jgi:hypothetical protein
VKLAEGDTPVTQHLRALEERMTASQQRHEETLAQRKTFEQIAKRLREENVSLQNQVRAACCLLLLAAGCCSCYSRHPRVPRADARLPLARHIPVALPAAALA